MLKFPYWGLLLHLGGGQMALRVTTSGAGCTSGISMQLPTLVPTPEAAAAKYQSHIELAHAATLNVFCHTSHMKQDDPVWKL